MSASAWNVLLSACDGDVSNLEGVTVFDRMSQEPTETNKSPKSAMLAWGLNHNGFNTEWQVSDSMGCGNHIALFPMNMGSLPQQSVALQTVVPFMQAHLQGQAQAAQFFDPLFPVPATLSALTTVERSHIPFIDFDYTNELTNFTNDGGFSPEPKVSNVTVKSDFIPEQAPFIEGAFTNWTRAGSDVSLEYDWGTSAQTATAIPADGYLEFRVAATALSSTGPADFSVELVNPDSTMTGSVAVSKYARLLGPQGNHTILQTVRIPFSDFAPVTKSIIGLRFVFDRSPDGGVVFAVASIRANYGAHPVAAPAATLAGASISAPASSPFSLVAGILGGPTTLLGAAQPGGSVAQQLALIHSGKLVIVTTPAKAGEQTFGVSGYDSADRSAIHFTLDPDQAAQIPHGTALRVFYRESAAGEHWNVGEWP